MLAGVPQGSALRELVFSVHINDLYDVVYHSYLC
jgi:hypothetical protein